MPLIANGLFSCMRRAREEEHHSHSWAPKFSFNHLPPQTPTMQATGLSVIHKMQTES